MNNKRMIAAALLGMASVVIAATVQARPEGTDRNGRSDGELQRWIVVLADPPLSQYDGRALSVPTRADKLYLPATAPRFTGQRKLNVRAPESVDYLDYLAERQEAFLLDAAVTLRRQVRTIFRYSNAMNGMAVDLSEAEALELAQLPGVEAVTPDERHHMLTDAGPEWIGADAIWNGAGGLMNTEGEGIVIGVIDGGINWDHPSFEDPANDGYNHSNPLGNTFGLCNMPSVNCNDKLIGVYDFVEDNPSTEVEEENTDGKDADGHGSHTASTAAGNRLNITVNGVGTTLSGVAPHANIISYRVCWEGVPPDPDGGSCQGSAILEAIDQAIADGVDVINYSLGSEAFDPWITSSVPRSFLNARDAGIFIAAASGNEGPGADTVGTPANAPWVIGVGNASHNRLLGTSLVNLSGGDSAPPLGVIGKSFVGGSGLFPIVHAKDFGFPLCGTGPDTSSSSCAGNSNSNPWAGGTPLTGMIVVCDRGEYGRIEKGKNVMLAGAEGYILANTDTWGEAIEVDNHCLPAMHIGADDGNRVRNWLNSGAGHQGAISNFNLPESNSHADIIVNSSSRGPIGAPVEDTLKPNLFAPGDDILAAVETPSGFAAFSGTSMSSPHIAGAAALLRALYPNWTVSQIASALETTSTNDLARRDDGLEATPHDTGSGRPQLEDAANAGLYLEVTTNEFINARPSQGGEPKDLNLSGLVNANCTNICDFERTVTDMVGGASWNATAAGFPAGVTVTVTPGNFNLGNAASQSLDIDVDLLASGIVNEWVFGAIELTSNGLPDQRLTVAVYSSLESPLPETWAIEDDRNGGWQTFQLSGLPPLPDATFTSGGLVTPSQTIETIEQDPTAENPEAQISPQNDDPFDGGTGTFTVWETVVDGDLWLYAETLESTAPDLDLFVGRDDNEDGVTDESELLCESISPEDLERCDLLNPEPGEYWIIVQNWSGQKQGGDEVTLLHAVIGSEDESDLVVSGPGIVPTGEPFDLRLSWSNNAALPGEKLLGAVGIGNSRDNPNNIGVIPVFFTRTDVGAPETMPLFNGVEQRFALKGNTTHDRIFFDVPPDVGQLVIEAQGAANNLSNNLLMTLYREDFATALNQVPFVQLPGGLNPITSASGMGGNGPSITINSADTITPGRYYIELTNEKGAHAAVTLKATATMHATGLSPHQGLWGFTRRISQGVSWNLNTSETFEFGLWYTYDEIGRPVWFIFSSAVVTGNIWTTEFLRVTNDGQEQQEKRAGRMSVTFIGDEQAIFSYRLYGRGGSDPIDPNASNTCPNVGGDLMSYTGHWGRGDSGLGGATLMVFEAAQAQVHYIFDDHGFPRWLFAVPDGAQSASAEELDLLQFNGFCAVCAETEPDFEVAGTVSRSFEDEDAGDWSLDFDLLDPLSQQIMRDDSVKKFSNPVICQ